MKKIDLKLGNMRKAESFIVYPAQHDTKILELQSNHRCLLILLKAKKGQLSRYIKQYPTFMHCSPTQGSLIVDISEDLINQIIPLIPKSGDKITGGRVIIA